MVSMVRLGFGAVLSALVALPAAAPAQAQTQNPAAEEQRIGDWKLLCPARKATQGPSCIITQTVSSTDTNMQILSVAVYFMPGEDVADIGFHLAPQAVPEGGMTMQIDQNQPVRLPIEKCDERKCATGANLRDPVLQQMRAGSQAIITFLLPNQQRVGVPVSLNGFTNAFRTLEQRRNR